MKGGRWKAEGRMRTAESQSSSEEKHACSDGGGYNRSLMLAFRILLSAFRGLSQGALP